MYKFEAYWFSKNRLTRKMPEWIGGNLPNLFVLKLGSNGFSGGISLELCQLKKYSNIGPL